MGETVDLPAIAKGCGYKHVLTAKDELGLDTALSNVNGCGGSVFLEVHVAIGSRPDLGRPTVSAIENKRAFMKKVWI